MKGTKFIKAVCRDTGKYFGLEVKKDGTGWKVVNFVDLSPQEASVITSEVKQDSFVTASNLQPCYKCGSRVVGGCSCAPKAYGCAKGKGYNFQCIYCKNLKIDYSEPASIGRHQQGETIRLSQGQEVKIRLPQNKPLTRIVVGVGWDPTRQGESMDVDSSVVVAGNTSREVVYFGSLEHPSGCVVHHGDNLTGENDGYQGDDENITVYLDKVPSNRDRLFFVLNIYRCEERRQEFGDVKNMYIKLYDPVSKNVLIEYKVDSNLKSKTALIIGMAYRKGQEWTFRAIGKGSKAKDISQLAAEVMSIR